MLSHRLTFKIFTLMALTMLISDCKKEEGITNDCQALKDTGIFDDYNFYENTSWTNYETYEEKLKACQIPQKVLHEMCTVGLIETCLNYPYWLDVFAFDNAQYGFNRLFRDNFNGVQELFKRNDAGIELLERYKNIDPGGYDDTWTLIEKGNLGWSLVHIEMVLAQKEIILKLNDNQKLELLKEALKKYEIKFEHIEVHGIPGLASSAYVLAHLMIEMHFTPFINALNNNQELQYFSKTSGYHINSDFINELDEIILFTNRLINLKN